MKKSKPVVLFIGQIWPEPSSTAAGQNICSYIRAFIDTQWEVHFWCSAQRTSRSANLSTDNINVQDVKLNDDSFNKNIRQLMPNVVVFDRFLSEEQFGWRVIQECPDALRILDCEDLHFLRHARELQFKNQKNKDRYATKDSIMSAENKHFLHSKDTYRELASVLRCDLSLVLSAFEQQLLVEFMGVPHQRVMHLPFIRHPLSQTFPSFSERQHIMTLGNLRHKPNVMAAEHLIDVIMPEARKKLPTLELHIFGAYAPPRITQRHNPTKGIFIKGPVNDQFATISQYRLMVAPIQFGAGVKGKILDAAATKTPSITTPIGAEGIDWIDWPGSVCQQSEEFVQQILHYYRDQHAWVKASKHALECMRKTYYNDDYASQLIHRIDSLRQNIEQTRSENFIQGMMLHQQLYAAKYMGQWITLKNQIASTDT